MPEQVSTSAVVLTVNGETHTESLPANMLLSEYLRDHLHLTGTHVGCDTSQCGACTVLLNGRATRSCLIPASSAVNAKIVTIEGLEQSGKLTHVQQAFIDEEAMQCGYCTSGMILAATALLSKTPHPTDEQIVAAMNGNICRCGTYPRILAAIHRAAEARRGEPAQLTGGAR